MKINYLFCALLLWLSIDLFAQKPIDQNLELGNFFINNYSREFLGSRSLNYTSAQSKDGIIYIGNIGKGVIEYDGQRVRQVLRNQEPMTDFAREMIIDSKETVYVGLIDNFGYLEKNKFGQNEYISLSDKLPKKEELNTTFWGLCMHHDTIFFQSENTVYLYKDKKYLRSYTFKENVHIITETPDGVYTRVWNVGFMKYSKAKGFQLIKGSEKLFATNRIDANYQLDNGDHLLVSRNIGLWRMSKQGEFTKVKNDFADDYVKKYDSYIGNTVLKNGKIPIITSKNGILFLNQNLTINALVEEQTGLPESGITNYIQDRVGDIWVGNTGMTRISFEPSLTNFSQKNGLRGIVSDIERINGQLYVRTGKDLFRLTVKKSVEGTSTFQSMKVVELGGKLLQFNDQVISTDNYAVNSLIKDKKVVVSKLYRSNWSVQSKLNPTFLFSSNSAEGLLLHQFKGGQWKQIALNGFQQVKSGYVSENIPGKLILNTLQGVGMYTYNETGQGTFEILKPDRKFMSSNRFLPFGITDKITLHLDSTYHVYVADENGKKLKYAGFKIEEIRHGEDWSYAYNKDAGYGWLVTEHGLFKMMFDSKKGFTYQEYPFYKVDLGELSSAIFAEGKGENEVVWIGSQDAKVFRYVPHLALKESHQAFKTLIRSISSNGTFVPINGGELTYDQNNLVFEVAYPVFGTESKTKFSYYLENQDAQWTAYQTDAKKEYTNLHEGTYIFHVKSKDGSGKESEETIVKIKISPPWYRTIFAYVIYLGMLLYGFILFGRFQAKKSLGKAENERRASELAAAKDLQNRLLPKKLPEVKGLEVATHLQTSTEVGGDYYDFDVQADGSMFAVCGDATGHGTAAGMLVSITKAGLIGLPAAEPNKMLQDLNMLVKKVDLGILRMSLNIVHIKKNELSISSAAMPPVYLFSSKNQTVEEIQLSGLPLGGLFGASFDLVKRSFHAGDVLVMASDGLAEAPNLAGEQLGYQAVENCILSNATKSAEEIRDQLVNLGTNWLGGQQTPDDITLVVIKKNT